MQPVIFLGPSLGKTVAAAHLRATFLPPIRRGDLTQLVEQGVKAVGIIDGEFGQSLSVSVAEVRSGLRRGVQIWGAASMGALRAVECRRLGMVGVGWIYERYADDTLCADDEVALVFDPRSGQAASVPLVNLRWAVEISNLPELAQPTGAALVQLARSIPFAERTLDELLRAASGTALEGAMQALVGFIRLHPSRCDRKRLDALLLLDAIRAAGHG